MYRVGGSGTRAGIVGLTSQVNKHAIGSERAGGGRRDDTIRYGGIAKRGEVSEEWGSGRKAKK